VKRPVGIYLISFPSRSLLIFRSLKRLFYKEIGGLKVRRS